VLGAFIILAIVNNREVQPSTKRRTIS